MESADPSQTAQGASGASEELPVTADAMVGQVEKMVMDMQASFQQVADQILVQLDDMGNRVGELEKTLGSLMETTGIPAPKLPSDGQ